MQKYHDEPKQYKGYLKSALAIGLMDTWLSVSFTHSSAGTRAERGGRCLVHSGLSSQPCESRIDPREEVIVQTAHGEGEFALTEHKGQVPA